MSFYGFHGYRPGCRPASLSGLAAGKTTDSNGQFLDVMVELANGYLLGQEVGMSEAQKKLLTDYVNSSDNIISTELKRFDEFLGQYGDDKWKEKQAS